MYVYRLASERYIHDLSGGGARLTGGRWNHKGIRIIYTSSSRALAALEYLVHVSITAVPGSICMATITIPDTVSRENVKVLDLPENWRRYPAPSELAEIGSDWAIKNGFLLLRVPSAVIEQEHNILINPSHPDMGKVKITNVQPFIFDERITP